MDAFEGLEPLSMKGRPSLGFDDACEGLGATEGHPRAVLDKPTEDDDPCSTFDVDTLLQPDYSSFTFWSNDSAALNETRGAAEIWRTGAGVVLPAVSSDQTFLSSLTGRLSDQSLQSQLDTRHTPFKSGYRKSESELFEIAEEGEPMVFVPSRVSTEDGTQKLAQMEGVVEKAVKKSSRRKRQPNHANLSPPRLKKQKVKVSAQARNEVHESAGSISGGRRHRRKASVSLEPLAVSEVSLEGDEDGHNHPETPTSSFSNLPIISTRRAAAKEGDAIAYTKVDDHEEAVLMPSSPNLPTRKASRLQKLQGSPSEGLSKPSKRTIKKIPADEARRSETRDQKRFTDPREGPAVKPKKGRQSKKTQKRTVSPLS